MNQNHSGREHIDPRLLALIDKSDEQESLNISDLQEGDVISVRTHSAVYTIKLVDPKEGRVLVNSNGRHVTQETEGNVWGTMLTGTGTMIKIKTIILGLRLVVWVKGIGELILSATQEVCVNGLKVMPLDQSHRPS